MCGSWERVESAERRTQCVKKLLAGSRCGESSLNFLFVDFSIFYVYIDAGYVVVVSKASDLLS